MTFLVAALRSRCRVMDLVMIQLFQTKITLHQVISPSAQGVLWWHKGCAWWAKPPLKYGRKGANQP